MRCCLSDGRSTWLSGSWLAWARTLARDKTVGSGEKATVAPVQSSKITVRSNAMRSLVALDWPLLANLEQ